MTLLDLAARCEAAEGPDRELDCLIRETLDPRWKPEWRVLYYGKPTGEHVDRDDGDRFVASPNYTASIDAAMKLVPEGWEWELENTGSDTFGPFVAKFGQLRDVEAKTLPLAICAAALRALNTPPSKATGGR